MRKPLKILQASAGSGKTFSLTAHYLTLLFSGANKYREILAVTFTNKATEEMKSRILEVLKGFAEGNDKYDGYKQIVFAAHPDLNEETLKLKADVTYRKILHDYSRFSVNTIDGFVQKVIRGFAFELGLDAGYALEMNYDKVKNELANQLDKALDQRPKLLQWIIDLALDRIENNKSWNYRNELLDLTGELFKERYQPFEQAIAELGASADIDELFKDYQTLTKNTISAFKTNVTTLADTADQILTVFGLDVTDLKGKSRSPLLNLKKIAAEDFTKISSLKKIVNEPELWFQKDAFSEVYEELNPVINALVEAYEAGLGDYETALGFNKNLYYLRLMQEMALILKTYREESGNLLISDAQNLLKGITNDADENPSFIWEKMGNRYKNFLFDEFQDTSANQWGSFRSLVSNAIAAPSGKLTDHLIVGDTKQSIYRWRNGDWNILHQQARKDLGAHNVVEESLEENYRSTANIINFNNELFTTMAQLLQNNLNADIASREGAADIAAWWQQNGYDHIVTAVYNGVAQKLTTRTPHGGTIKYQIIRPEGADGDPDKTPYAAQAIEKAIAEIRRLIDEQHYQPKEICVLVRKNQEAIAMVKALLDNNINVISGEALLIGNNNAVKLILNTLQMLVGVSENTALYKANAISLYARSQGKAVEPANLYGLNRKQIAQLSHVLPPDLCLSWQSWMQQPLPELIEKIIQSYGLHEQETAIPYLFALRDLAGNFVRQGEKGVAAFLRFWEEEGVKKTLPASESADAVQVLTVHKSKGLAFRAVMLPFCNWEINGRTNSIFWVPAADTPYHQLQNIPLKYNKNLGNASVAKAYFEEQLFNNMDAFNMLYVATTRAKEYLYITTQGKKTDSISNIGDLLSKALALKIEDDAYILDEPVSGQGKQEEPQGIIGLKRYPVSDRLSKVFDAGLKTRDIELLTGDNAGRKGTILHEVLAKATTKADIPGILDALLLDGVFKAGERDELQEQAYKVLENAGLQEMLKSSTQSLTEQSIIATDGKSYRPDKVLINEDGVIIIDYKFTKEENDKHIEQISHYKALLIAMGYKNVQTYLFYAVSGVLKLV